MIVEFKVVVVRVLFDINSFEGVNDDLNVILVVDRWWYEWNKYIYFVSIW